MTDAVLAALIDALDSLNVYLMANWDEQARKRVRANFAIVEDLLRAEQKDRRRKAKAAKADAAKADAVKADATMPLTGQGGT